MMSYSNPNLNTSAYARKSSRLGQGDRTNQNNTITPYKSNTKRAIMNNKLF